MSCWSISVIPSPCRDGDRLGVDAEILRQFLLQKTEGFEPLRKDHEPVVRRLSRPAETAECGRFADHAYQLLILAEAFDADRLDQLGKGFERCAVGFGLRPLFAVQTAQAGANGLQTRRRARQQCLFEGGTEEFARGAGASVDASERQI
jgi:hypothetical protein